MSWLRSLFGKSDRIASNGAPPAAVRKMNPNKILFSVPTLADDLASCDPIDRPPTRSDVVLSEDDWSQLEFIPLTSRPTIEHNLTELKTFAQANRKAEGWRKVYVRKIPRAPVISSPDPLRHVAQIVGVEAGDPPFITSGGAIVGRASRGFTFDLGGNVHLYGYRDLNGAIPVLAASVGPKADNMKLASAFMKLHRNDAVMLVDWRAQLLLVGVTADGNIETWRP